MDRTMTVGSRRLAVLGLLLPVLALLPILAFVQGYPAPEATGWLMGLVLPAVLAATLPVLLFRIALTTILALVLGVLLIHPLPGAVMMVALLVNLSSVAASAVVTRRLVESADRGLERIRGRAELDQLTSTLNRRGLQRHLAAAFTTGTEVTVAVVDLDHLKHLNDRYGHDAGDRALVQVAAALRNAVPGGLVARIGGDEFLVLVPGTDPGFAPRVRHGLRPATRPVTVSIGTATGRLRNLGPQALDDLVRDADVNLYRDKSPDRPLPDEPPERIRTGPRPDGEQAVFGRSTRRLLAVVAGAFGVLTIPAIVFNRQLIAFGEHIEPLALLICLVLDFAVVFFLLRPGTNRQTVAPALMTAMASLGVMSLSGTGQFMSTAVWVVPLLPAFQVLDRRSRHLVFLGVAAVRLWIVIQAIPLGAQATMVAVAQLGIIVAVVGWLGVLHARSNRVRELLNDLSGTDPLTGLLNRGGLERAVAEREWATATVTVLDIDRFKLINDRHGHAVGDQVLMELSAELRCVHPDAVIGRLGGDEFVVVDGSDPAPADKPSWPVTVTVGVATGTVRNAVALWTLVRRADAVLMDERRDRRSPETVGSAPPEDHS